MRRLSGREAKALLEAAMRRHFALADDLKQVIRMEGYRGTLEAFLEYEVGRFVPTYWVFQSKKPPFRIHPAASPDEEERKEPEERVPTTHWVRFLVERSDGALLPHVLAHLTTPDGKEKSTRLEETASMDVKEIVKDGRCLLLLEEDVVAERAGVIAPPKGVAPVGALSRVRLKLAPSKSQRVGIHTDASHRVIVEGPLIWQQEAGLLLVDPGSALCVPGPWTEWRHPFAALVSAVRCASAKVANPIVAIVGRMGSDSPALSLARADGLRCLIENQPADWVDLATSMGSLRDVLAYVEHLRRSRGWTCQVEEIEAIENEATRTSIEDFQRCYNERHDASIVSDGICGKQTLGAVFHVMRDELRIWMEAWSITEEQLKATQFVYLDDKDAKTASDPGLEIFVCESDDFGESDPSGRALVDSRIATKKQYADAPYITEEGTLRIVFANYRAPSSTSYSPKDRYILEIDDGELSLEKTAAEVQPIEKRGAVLDFEGLKSEMKLTLVHLHGDSNDTLFHGVRFSDLLERQNRPAPILSGLQSPEEPQSPTTIRETQETVDLSNDATFPEDITPLNRLVAVMRSLLRDETLREIPENEIM